MSELERELPKVDKSGHPLTDYSSSRFSPERRKLLNYAEVDYVNGVEKVDEEGNTFTHYPSQRELAAQYNLPEQVIADQAVKNNWLPRRKMVQHEQSVYDRMMRIKARREKVDKLQGAMVELMDRIQSLNSYMAWELELKMKAELERFAQAQAAGEDYLPNAGIRNADVESLSRTADHVGKSRERLVKELDRQDREAIIKMVAEIEAPKPLPSVEDEQRLKEIAAEAERKAREDLKAQGISETELAQVWAEMVKIQQFNDSQAARAAKTIQGELDDEDDEDE